MGGTKGGKVAPLVKEKHIVKGEVDRSPAVLTGSDNQAAAYHFIESLLHEVELQVNLSSVLKGACPEGLHTHMTLVSHSLGA